MHWLHVREDGTIEGVSGSERIRRLPTAPNGYRYVEATPLRLAAWFAYLDEAIALDEARPIGQRVLDLRAKMLDDNIEPIRR